jgi:hypothetical protein
MDERELFEQRHQKLISMAVKFHDDEMDAIRDIRDDVKDLRRGAAGAPAARTS